MDAMTLLGYYTVPAYDQSGIVAIDCPCAKCGNDLRGLHLHGRCSNCGTAVGATLFPQQLNYADPEWLATIRKGLLTLLWGTIISVVAIGGLSVVIGIFLASGAIRSGAIGTTSRPTNSSAQIGLLVQENAWFFVTIGLATLVAVCVYAWATWRLTTPEPMHLGKPSADLGLGIWIRRLLVFTVCHSVINLFAQLAFGPTLASRSPVFVGIAAILSIVDMAGAWAQIIYIARLADRVPDPKLAGRTRFSGWGISISFALMAGAQILLLAMGVGSATAPNSLDGGIIAISCLNGLVSLFFLACCVIYLVSVGQLSRRVGQALQFVQWLAAQPAAPALQPVGVLPYSPSGLTGETGGQ